MKPARWKTKNRGKLTKWILAGDHAVGEDYFASGDMPPEINVPYLDREKTEKCDQQRCYGRILEETLNAGVNHANPRVSVQLS